MELMPPQVQEYLLAYRYCPQPDNSRTVRTFWYIHLRDTFPERVQLLNKNLTVYNFL